MDDRGRMRKREEGGPRKRGRKMYHEGILEIFITIIIFLLDLQFFFLSNMENKFFTFFFKIGC